MRKVSGFLLDVYKRQQVAITEDVLVDDRGYIYLDTFMDGLYIVRIIYCTVKRGGII